MQITGNTLLITGGASGIGRGLAEAFHRLGNQVIIAGRRQALLDEVAFANPGMEAIPLDVSDLASLPGWAAKLVARFPALNGLINNAGIMRIENLLDADRAYAEAEVIVNTNLLAPIRLTTALLPQLQRQPRATVMNVSSGLAFVPMAITPTYCAAKAAIHSWTETLRLQLRRTRIEVLELIPPYVATDLLGRRAAPDPRAMPLDAFLAEVMEILRTRPEAREIRVGRVEPLRLAEREGRYEAMLQRLNPPALS